MEKREFSLSPKWSRRWIIAVSLLCAVDLGLGIWLCWLDRNLSVWLPTAIQPFLWVPLLLAPRQAGKLEISDEGLFLTVRRGVGYRLRWSAITSVRVHEQSTAARYWSVIVEDSQGHVVKVPRKCPDSAEIIEILRQHLPESVFQVW